MRLSRMAGDDACHNGTCPTVFAIDECKDEAVVQGDTVTDPDALAQLDLGSRGGCGPGAGGAAVGRRCPSAGWGVNVEEFGRLFTSFERSAFRLETLPQYLVADEAETFADFQAGRPLARRTPETDDWLRMIAQDAVAGKRWVRVHVVEHPLSAYLRYELACYADSVAAGEQVFIADQDAYPELAVLDREDFWLFDDRLVVRMRYDLDGHWLGAERALDADLDGYRRRRDLALAHAVPLEEYLATRGGSLDGW